MMQILVLGVILIVFGLSFGDGKSAHRDGDLKIGVAPGNDEKQGKVKHQNFEPSDLFSIEDDSNEIWDFEPKVRGGRKADVDSWQFIGYLEIGNDRTCVGSAIGKDRFLTAAHCLVSERLIFKPESINIKFGCTNLRSSSCKILTAKNFDVHPNFTIPRPLSNDMAVIELNQDLDDYIRLAKDPVEDGTICTTAGWADAGCGLKHSDTLSEINVPIVNINLCNGRNYYKGKLDVDSMICAGAVGIDACHGDSGAPLICNGHLQAIVTTGDRCNKRKNRPGVYTSVHSNAWLEQFKTDDL